MFFLALRHLLARKKQSALILFGIILGTTAFIAISGVMVGFQSYLLDQLVNNEAQIRISAEEKALSKETFNSLFFADEEYIFWHIPPTGRRDASRIINPQGWYERLDAEADVLAYSPQVTAPVLLSRGGVHRHAKIIGSDVERQIHVSNIKQYITEGSFESLSTGGNKLIVGEGLLRMMGAQVSETIFVSTDKSAAVPFKIVGKFRFGSKTIDESTALSSLSDAQKLRHAPNQITDIAVRVRDPQKAREMAQKWALTSSEKVQSWDQINATTLGIFRTLDLIRNFMTLSIIAVAAFGIYNILSVLVRQKRREIAILRAMGYDARDIVYLFFLQGLFLGIIGGVIGMLLGYLASKGIATIKVSNPQERFAGLGDTMIVAFDAMIYVRAMLMAFFSAVLSSILPALNAGKLTPMEIFREGS